MSDFVIHTDELTKRYGKILAVDGLSLEVPRGRIFGAAGTQRLRQDHHHGDVARAGYAHERELRAVRRGTRDTKIRCDG